ncbi:MAG: pyruvate ferredoxin oxidoreductase [Actinomycetes bacterium]|jgi:pyruvate ferredoxin oxidoreductase alpha subunit|nr:pyruvate ferredoxin oxidoreductase [Actinomycetes bacterium]
MTDTTPTAVVGAAAVDLSAVEQRTIASTGNLFVAEAFRQIDPDAVCAYPITPQTTIVEEFAKFVANGRVHTEYVTVESEHSAMSATIGASAAGGRAFTVTSSQGLALMWEELHIASGLRLPIVMINANRAISAPINIHGDHSDVMGARDSGWIILMAENAQEAYDNTIIATRVAEAARLPVMPTLDGFITTHSIARGQVADDATVKAFVGEYVPDDSLLRSTSPVMVGAFANLGPTYMKVKKAERDAIDASLPIIGEVGAQWASVIGRDYGHVESYGVDDADLVVVIMGSAAGNVRAVVRRLREQGQRVGVVKVRTYRPFPAADLAAAVSGARAIAVLDRAESFGAPAGPLALDTLAALYGAGIQVPVRSYLYGLGGADVRLDLVEQVYADLADVADDGDGLLNPTPRYLGIR